MSNVFWVAFVFGMLGGLIGLRATAGSASSGPPVLAPVFDRLSSGKPFGAVGAIIGGTLLVAALAGGIGLLHWLFWLACQQ